MLVYAEAKLNMQFPWYVILKVKFYLKQLFKIEKYWVSD